MKLKLQVGEDNSWLSDSKLSSLMHSVGDSRIKERVTLTHTPKSIPRKYPDPSRPRLAAYKKELRKELLAWHE